MSKLICKLTGVRGRSIAVYDNKCVITTDVTLGSLLTSNALDGEKTIFYIDVAGVQFKASGMTIGYLQLETPSMQMNNQSSNMFSENTFTFEDGKNGVTNRLMVRVRNYIVERIEGYKYGTIADISEETLQAMLELCPKEPERPISTVSVRTWTCSRCGTAVEVGIYKCPKCGGGKT